MTIKKRLARSNIAMFVIPVLVAAVLLLIGLGIGFTLLERVYLPQLGISLGELYQTGEEIERLLSDSAAILRVYAGAVVMALLLTIAWTNYYLTRNLFRHISEPLEALTAGVARVRDGDLDTPIAYREADEFKAARDAVDEMAARLKASLEERQSEQQRKQELIAGMSHDLKSPPPSIRAYTEALLEGVAQDEAAKERYLRTIRAKEADMEAMVNRLFEFAKMDVSEYPVQREALPLRETLAAVTERLSGDGAAVTLDGVPALADSVPGVSGGTIAFILGFYERFLDALHGLFRGTGAERKAGLLYLLKLGLGWDAGMAACVVLLSGLFARNIYFMSSLFLGLTACSIPFVALSERKALLARPARHGWFLLLGVAIVVGLTLLRSGTGTLGSVSYTQLSLPQFGYLFLSGAVAITAMVLPGISGSSILLIAGVYLPTIQAVHRFLRLQFDVVPGLCALGLGVLAGVGLSIHAIRAALRKYRGQTVWLILGLMLGSLYAIANGPASLDPPLPPMGAATFQVPAFLLGVVILLALEFLRKTMERREEKRRVVQKGESLS